MRYAMISFVPFFAACAAVGPVEGPGPQAPPSVQATGTGMEVRLNRDDRPAGEVISTTREEAWKGLLQTYTELELPIDVGHSNRNDGVLATEQFDPPRRLLDRPLSTYLDCGSSIDGPRVKLWRVSARLVSTLEDVDDGVLVSTHLTASAQPRDGTSTRPIDCSSTGRLEQEIVRLVGEGAQAADET